MTSRNTVVLKQNWSALNMSSRRDIEDMHVFYTVSRLPNWFPMTYLKRTYASLWFWLSSSTSGSRASDLFTTDQASLLHRGTWVVVTTRKQAYVRLNLEIRYHCETLYSVNWQMTNWSTACSRSVTVTTPLYSKEFTYALARDTQHQQLKMYYFSAKGPTVPVWRSDL